MKKTVLMFLWGALLTSQLVIAQQPREYPLVVRADAPVYPPLARMAKITGKIQAEFTIKGGEVVAAEAKTGHPFLVKATTENIRSWHFAPEANGTFTATFVYELHGNETATMQNPKVEMQLPVFVKIAATPTRPSCNDCEPGADIVGKPIKGQTLQHEGGHSGDATSAEHNDLVDPNAGNLYLTISTVASKPKQ